MNQTTTIDTSDAAAAKRATHLITTNLRRYAELESLINTVTTDQQAKVNAIVTATKETLKPLVDEKAGLKALIERLANEYRALLYGTKSKTLDLGTHALSFRASQSVVCDNEEEMIDALEAAIADPECSESHRLAATACLRYESPTLDKSFVKKHWKKHTAWFRDYFGFRLVSKETFNITSKTTPDLSED